MRIRSKTQNKNHTIQLDYQHGDDLEENVIS